MDLLKRSKQNKLSKGFKMNTQNVSLPIEFKTMPCNLETVEPTWYITMHLGGLKIQEFTYYGKSEKQGIKAAKQFLKDMIG